MRGERSLICRLRNIAYGSSPHARGTHKPMTDNPTARRFIPACAGNASALTRKDDRALVHPRMRGERLRN